MSIERFCLRSERALSWGSRVPILGVVPAIIKVALGIIQFTLALLFTLVSLPFCCCNQTLGDFCKRSATHIAHGFGNICAGTAEAVAFSVFSAHLFLNDVRAPYSYDGNYDGQYDKCLSYLALLDDDICDYPAL